MTVRAQRRLGPGRPLLRLPALLAAALLAACASRGVRTKTPGESPGAPAQPVLRVVYPLAGDTLTASDSTFIFGSVRPPGARVTVNGVPARQAESGGWLAYVPIAPGEFVFHVEARSPAGPQEEAPRGAREARAAGGGSTALDWPVRVPRGLDASWNAVLDTASVSPRDSMELEPGDPVVLRFKGVPGLEARAVLGEGLASAAFGEELAAEANLGRRVFGAAEGGIAGGRLAVWSWYRAELRLPSPGPGAASPRKEVEGGAVEGGGRPEKRGHREAGGHEGRARAAVERRERAVRKGAEPAWTYGSRASLAIEIARGDSALRYALPGRVRLRDPAALTTVVLDDDPERTGRTDGRVVGLTAPDGVYFLFLPNGTHAAAARRVGKFVELRLDDDLSVWADASNLRPLPPGRPAPRSLVPVVRTRRLGRWTRVVVPLAEPLPVQVRQETDPARYVVTIFGATAATEFMRYDFGDPLVRELRWNQPARARFVLEVELDQRQPWGFRYGFEGSDFYLDVRRAPELRTGLFRSILKGLRIIVDPGHSPDPGATGPTRYLEKDANLAVALELARRLRDEGAEVTLTRSGEAPRGSLGLNDRTNLAARADADLLISVHHNALPDGVNPFENNGTSTYYYFPQSLSLARAIQRELLHELGLPDFGIAHGNLALVRPTEMPAVLTEAAFMMIPEQEALLRTEDFREREARAIVRGIKRFLKEARREAGPRALQVRD